MISSFCTPMVMLSREWRYLQYLLFLRLFRTQKFSSQRRWRGRCRRRPSCDDTQAWFVVDHPPPSMTMRRRGAQPGHQRVLVLAWSTGSARRGDGCINDELIGALTIALVLDGLEQAQGERARCPDARRAASKPWTCHARVRQRRDDGTNRRLAAQRSHRDPVPDVARACRSVSTQISKSLAACRPTRRSD